MSCDTILSRDGCFIARCDAIHCEDCEHLKAKAALVYCDPPWFTQRDHDQFDDRWASLEEYISYLRPRIEGMKYVLAPYGSFVLHCDSHASYELKLLCDSVFGRRAFVSEIVWHYRRWPAKTRNFQRVHDVLLRWRASTEHETRWNQLYEPLAPSTLKQWGTGKQVAVIEGGKRKRSSVSSKQSPGVPMGDVWDIPIIAPRAKERTKYPTQKPLALLERLVLATTNPGDWVIDAMCGSGTTLLAALKHNRRALGLDISTEATVITRDRVLAFFSEQEAQHDLLCG